MNKFYVTTALILTGALLAFSGYLELLGRPEYGLRGAAAWYESAIRTGGMLTSPFPPWPLGLQGLKTIPWQLQLARILLPAGLLLGTATLIYQAFGRELRVFRARFARDHVVICGLGDPAWHLAADLVSRGRSKVVVIGIDAGQADAERFRRLGVPVLGSGSRVDKALLCRAALPRAKAVVALSENDLANVEIMLTAQRLGGEERSKDRPPLIGRANVAELVMRETYGLLLDASHGALAYRPVSIARNMVRQLLGQYPLDLDPEVRNGGRVHVVIVGFGRTGQELALEVARSAHYADGRAPLISILDREATTHADAFLARYPGLRHAVELRAVDVSLQVGRMGTDARLAHLVGPDRPSRAVICFAGGSLGLATAVGLRAGAPGLPIHVRLSNAPAIAQSLRDGAGRYSGLRIRPFGDAATLFTKEIVLEESLDVLARAVHESYLEAIRSVCRDPATHPADLPWEELPETFRDASRRQGDHIAPKLRAIGCEIVADTSAAPFRFQAEEVEFLARMEHARWCAERFVSGWRVAPVENEPAQEHPSLVPWEALPESEREKDRAAVRAIPGILARVGRSVRRAGTAAASDPSGAPVRPA